ncbi:SMI1/KNR4 family protein [Thermoactinomyces sp. DSM 45892]|uniref:SMI1/KNR4 family protein n=1 Tax=Thermoactinomyces sp. DSM 45892 TaxID=1882753 RepID=UPI00089AE661|nr:SMI1/KNR4 family protein [Thermoactinomyces sp. DSM 45892]SDY22073.1 SMI1-KNR4 cell-wall [Thermoactinomyces sp. DSM 45892]
MVKVISKDSKLGTSDIERLEAEIQIQLPKEYKSFLLKFNGGYTVLPLFRISDEQGVSVVNNLFGTGSSHRNLQKVIDILEDRMPEGFIPIGDDPSGNMICVGTKAPYYDHIYFWDHEEEAEDEPDMSNMYFLANNIFEFLDSLYDDPSVYE